MTRLISTMKLDFVIQWRNRFYYIGIGLALLVGSGLVQLFDHEALRSALPILFLFTVGGTTMIYVAGLLVFERDQQTLDAMLVSPLRLSEYLASKIVTLTFLALVESLMILALSYGLSEVNLGLLLVGIIAMSVMLALMGFILVVRFDSITDFLLPMALLAFILELPALYFTGLVDTPLWLLIPSGGPMMIMWGGWHTLEPWQWIYGVGYSMATIAVLQHWTLAAFNRHIILKERG